MSKNHPAVPVHAPEPNVKKETEFFRRDHAADIPSAPTTENDLAALEKATNSPAHVTRIDHHTEAPNLPFPAGIPAPGAPAFPGPAIVGAVPPVPALTGPGGREVERRNGVTYLKGTDVVVGGPTQQ